ncbi:aminotransferase class III-fold pyridoxal phosphate-dependent enzyme [Chromobacterium phragmitis]|uniref:Aminotransferase class III-fold pyridoxal phosphate-dependent enzyme n=1 Tax=Chromobacterium phragmitis TaxID=2202141 RepID=A0ABV0ISP9_9NEIS
MQGEGGLNCASAEWLQGVAALARKLGSLLIVDEMQTGCGRTGRFYQFRACLHRAGIFGLSKSLGGGGLPCSLNLIKPEIDAWNSGEHNRIFRGYSLAMVMAVAALRKYWAAPHFVHDVEEKGQAVAECLQQALKPFEGQVRVVGKGLMLGLRYTGRAMDRGAAAGAALSARRASGQCDRGRPLGAKGERLGKHPSRIHWTDQY